MQPQPTPPQLSGLKVSHLRKDYITPAGTLTVLVDVSFALTGGQTLAVVGPSGAGKSTLLNIIGSLEKPTSGSVLLNSLDVTSLSESDLASYRAQSVGFIFQDHHLLPQLTSLENVLLPTLALPARPDAPDLAQSLLERVGLGGRLHSFPAQLSGGERQRVAIARALVNNPGLLLADEPTGNLDHDSASAVADLFVQLAAEKSAILIVVTHNLDLARRFQRTLRLHDGHLTEPPLGPSLEARPHPEQAHP